MSKRALPLLFLLLLVVLSVSLSACATSTKAVIQPLDSIPGGFDGPYVRDIGPQSVKIVFSTTVPVVCNVAYGIDDRYGKLAIMPMADATTQHELHLVGLEPNTTYHFRATVIDLAGNVYQSDDLTFLTGDAMQKTNLAGRNVAALSSGARIAGLAELGLFPF